MTQYWKKWRSSKKWYAYATSPTASILSAKRGRRARTWLTSIASKVTPAEAGADGRGGADIFFLSFKSCINIIIFVSTKIITGSVLLIGLVDSFWLRRRGDHAVVDYNGCRDAMRRDSWWRWLESRTGRQLRAILFKAWRTYNTSYYLYHHLLSLVFSSLHFPEHISIAAVWPTYLFGAQVFDIFPTTHWNATTVRSSI